MTPTHLAVFLGAALLAAGCRSADGPSGPPTNLPVVPTAVSSAAAPDAAVLDPSPEPFAPAVVGGPGPAYALVTNVGILRIDGGGASTVLAAAKGTLGLFSSIVPDRAGDLWVSDYGGIQILPLAGGGARHIPGPGADMMVKGLHVRAPNDAWAVTDEIGWAVVHYDGKRWSRVRRRADFPGQYEDNKWEALAITPGTTWVASWNGLWRSLDAAGSGWERVAGPPSGGRVWKLFVVRDQLVVEFLPGGCFVREAAGWRALAWPGVGLRAVSDAGVGVAWDEGDRVEIGSVTGAAPARSVRLKGRPWDAAVDEGGRVWVATDAGISVVERTGRILSEWTSGTLDGLTGRVNAVAVVRGGPAPLPAARTARQWEIVGRLSIYKSAAPLAGARIELCPFPRSACAGSAAARTATSAGDGSFRLADVPEGSFRLHVEPPPGLPDCASPFTETGSTVEPARDCRADPARPGVCDLGTLKQCWPFEMPPMRR